MKVASEAPDWLLTHKGELAIAILEDVIEFLDHHFNRREGLIQAAEVLDWIAGLVIEKKEG